MKEPVSFRDLAPLIKKRLKEKRLTYRALAEALGISESSVKKLFLAEDCSLSRLGRIASFLGLGLEELISSVNKQALGRFRFTEKQERFLAENRRYFQVYWKLVYEELPPGEVRKFLHLKESELFSILRRLDQMGLLALLPGGKIKVPDMSMILWEGEGPLLEMTRKEWAPLIVRRVSQCLGQEGYGLGLRYFSLRQESINEFKRTLEEIQLEFGRRSVRESRLYREECRPVFLVSAVSPSCFVEEL